MSVRRVIIDCDPGIDDALALLLAVRSPEVSVEAVTVVCGNVLVERGAENALQLLELAGRSDIPVAKGARRPLLREPLTGEAIHGENGLGGVSLPPPAATPDPRHAADLIIDLVTGSPGEITLVAIAPLTNLALAFSKEPAIRALIPEIILMGGSLAGGNITPAAEYNIYADAEAARIVFEAGIPITMLQLTTTSQAVLTRRHLEQWCASGSVLAAAAAAMAETYLRVYERRGLPGGYLHDPLAAGLAIDKTLVRESRPMRVEIETHGEFTYGATVADRRPGERSAAKPNAELPLLIDGERFVGMLVERLSAPPR